MDRVISSWEPLALAKVVFDKRGLKENIRLRRNKAGTCGSESLIPAAQNVMGMGTPKRANLIVRFWFRRPIGRTA